MRGIKDLNHVIARHLMILSRSRLHHSIPRGRFTLFSHKSSYSTDLRFSSVVRVFLNFVIFSWISDIGIWKSRPYDVTENFQASIRNQWTEFYQTPGSNSCSVRGCPLRGHPNFRVLIKMVLLYCRETKLEIILQLEIIFEIRDNSHSAEFQHIRYIKSFNLKRNSRDI